MKTLITVSLLLCGKLICAQQDTLVLDSNTVKNFKHAYQSASEAFRPDYVRYKLDRMNREHGTGLAYCTLDELTLSNGDSTQLFVISETNFQKVTKREVYFLALSDDADGIMDGNFIIYELFTVGKSTYGNNGYYSAKLIGGQFLYQYPAGNSLPAIQDLFQPEYEPVVTGLIWDSPPITLSSLGPISINWNPILFIPSCIFGPTTAVVSLPEAKPIPKPFDFNGYFSALNKEEFFDHILSKPYNAVFTNHGPLEKGCFELSEVVLLGKLKEVTNVVQENRKA